MKTQRKNKGFTLAEVLIVVAIISVLASVAFIAVPRYLRSLTQLEYDGIAKEIFVAAQNHLTMAENQGYLKAPKTQEGTNPAFGNSEGTNSNVYYFVLDRGNLYGQNGSQVLKMMLPFGAVDETVRVGGSYLIQYQAQPARVLNVFYSSPSGRFGHVFLTGEYDAVTALAKESAEAKNGRRFFGTNNDVIGWYGGEAAWDLKPGPELKVPDIEVINAERLQVRVTTPNRAGSLKLIIKGLSSGAEKEFPLISNGTPTAAYQENGSTSNFIVTLDDITKGGMHFLDLMPGFWPGENISVQAVAFNNQALSNIAYSAEKTTNSLYADAETVTSSGSGSSTRIDISATIANIRHLENLDPRVSGIGKNDSADQKNVTVSSANQITDLSWTDFESKLGTTNTQVYAGSTPTDQGCFLPVTPPDGLDYDGQLHRISDIKVRIAADAGIFGTLTDGSVSALLVIDSEITSTKGNAGGLIGKMTGTTVTGCASTAIVSITGGTGDAGGLIGAAGGGTVIASYSGGHTDGTGAYAADSYNVSGPGAVGGLIGSTAETSVQYCYSTCSASGDTAGGLIGRLAEDSSVSDCYAVGLVKGTTNAGALLGTATGTLSGNNYYYEIINELPGSGTNGISYLGPVNNTANAYVTAIDLSATSYNDFVGDPDSWKPAVPYDSALINYYQNKYNLKTISQLLGNQTVTYEYFDTHYGDWPAPEIFIINFATPSSGDGTTDTSGNP